jgi:hypothetical protein
MDRFNVADHETFVLVTEKTIPGRSFFSCFGAKKASWGYRGCGVFSVPSGEREANVKALLTGKFHRYRVFDNDTGRELTI